MLIGKRQKRIRFAAMLIGNLKKRVRFPAMQTSKGAMQISKYVLPPFTRCGKQSVSSRVLANPFGVLRDAISFQNFSFQLLP